MSHQTVVRLIDQVGSNHDFEVKKWKSLLEENLTWNFAEVSLNKYIGIMGHIHDF